MVAAPVLHGWQWVAVLTPAFVTLLLTRVNGIPMLEASADERSGGQYITNQFEPSHSSFTDAASVCVASILGGCFPLGTVAGKMTIAPDSSLSWFEPKPLCISRLRSATLRGRLSASSERPQIYECAKNPVFRGEPECGRVPSTCIHVDMGRLAWFDFSHRASTSTQIACYESWTRHYSATEPERMTSARPPTQILPLRSAT